MDIHHRQVYQGESAEDPRDTIWTLDRHCVEKVGIFGIRVVSLLCKQAVCTLTRRVCKVGGDVVECDVLERLKHQCYWKIVTVN